MPAAIYIGKITELEKKLTSCHSIFRLIGNNEDALTRSLGYLLAHDRRLCLDILKFNNIFKKKRTTTWETLLADYSIRLQEVTEPKGGRRDIVIDSKHLRIVIEAKIGRAHPTSAQIEKYIGEFRGHERDHKAIIALVRDSRPTKPISEECARNGIVFYALRWRDILEILQRAADRKSPPDTKHLYEQFLMFAKEDYKMGFYDVEVKVQDVDEENAKIYHEGRMYIGSPVEALYFAPYFTGGGGITHVSRVVHLVQATIDESMSDLLRREFDSNNPEYAEHWKYWEQGLALILQRAKRRGRKGGFYGEEGNLHFLGEPISVRSGKKALLKSNVFRQIPRHYSLRFDQLLTLEKLGSPKTKSNVRGRGSRRDVPSVSGSRNPGAAAIRTGGRRRRDGYRDNGAD